MILNAVFRTTAPIDGSHYVVVPLSKSVIPQQEAHTNHQISKEAPKTSKHGSTVWI